MSKLILSKENASKTISIWKTQVQNYLQSIQLPKKFLGTRTTSTTIPASSSKTEITWDFHEVQSFHDFVIKHIPPPDVLAYPNEDSYREDFQKYKQCVAKVKVEMKEFLSEELYEIFVSEEDCDEGMKSVLLEVKYDEASQLRVLARKLELIAQQDTQTTKEYADSVNHLILQLQTLGIKTSEAEFQYKLAERFLLGMTLVEGRRLRSVFQMKNITTFKAMRAVINEEAANEELSKAQRNYASVHETPSALVITEKLEAEILKIVKKAVATPKQPTKTSDQTKVFVKSLNSKTTEDQLEAAFRSFGQVVSVYLLKFPDGAPKRCGFIEFKDKFAAEAAIRQSGEITVCGKLILVEAVKRREIKPQSSAYLSALVDSGCTPSHLTPQPEILNNLSTSKQFSLNVADGRSMTTSGMKGDFTVADLEVKDTEVVPGLSNTLLSVYAFLKDKKDVWFRWEDMSVNIGHLDHSEKHEVLAKGSARGGLFELNVEPKPSAYIATSVKKTWDLWHKRFMHYGVPTLKNTLDLEAVRGLDVTGPLPPALHCHNCIQGKMHRLPHPPSRYGVENLKGGKLSRIAVDILYMPIPSMSGAKYVVGVTVVSANGFKLCYPCHSKSEMVSKLRFAKKYLENLTGEKIAEIVADKGGENISKEVLDICLEAGIILSKTGTEEHQSNGQIESWWRVALDCWRSHQIASGCPMNLWADGLCYLAYIYNRLVHKGHSKTPYEALTNQIPSVHDLRVFGCLAYAYVLPKTGYMENSPHVQSLEFSLGWGIMMVIQSKRKVDIRS